MWNIKALHNVSDAQCTGGTQLHYLHSWLVGIVVYILQP
jgi:hypothetical protein